MVAAAYRWIILPRSREAVASAVAYWLPYLSRLVDG